MPENDQIDSNPVIKALKDVGADVLGDFTFTHPTEVKIKDIIEYESRLRVSPLEKFNATCYISVLNFYASSQDLAKKKTLGALIVYMEEESIGKILKKFTNRRFDEDDEGQVMEQCNELMHKFSASLASSLSALGHTNIVFSEPKHFRNAVADGIEFNYDERKLYEASFFIWKKKVAVCELTVPVRR